MDSAYILGNSMFVCFFSRNFSQIVLPALRNLGKKHPCRFVVVTSSKNVSIFLGYIYILLIYIMCVMMMMRYDISWWYDIGIYNYIYIYTYIHYIYTYYIIPRNFSQLYHVSRCRIWPWSQLHVTCQENGSKEGSIQVPMEVETCWNIVWRTLEMNYNIIRTTHVNHIGEIPSGNLT